MKFLKLFNTNIDYKAYRDGDGYIKPNVSLSVDTKNVYYNLNNNGHPYVDLGLPSGTLWAMQNVGASKPSDYGLYFAWGETQGYTSGQVGTGDGQKKFASDWSDYKWGVKPNFSKYTTNGATLELEDDAAHVNMGGRWHIPTPTQIRELINNTAIKWMYFDGQNVMKFTSRKDKSKFIFIPASGSVENGSNQFYFEEGKIWSSMIDMNTIGYGQSLYFSKEIAWTDVKRDYRCSGLSVRGVIG